jgi:hypothetical protein
VRVSEAAARRAGLISLIVAGYAAMLVANLPGHFSPDSIYQLSQGRSGVFNSWHPPVMAWLLGVADRLSPGAAAFVVADGALFFGGLVAFAALDPRPRWGSFILIALLMASPLVLIYQGDVWKDVLFANAALAGFAALAWAGNLWAWPAWRWTALTMAFALFALASLARQNGFVVPLCGAAALAVMSLASGEGRRLAPAAVVRAALYGLAALVLVVGVNRAATYGLDLYSDGEPETENQLKRLQVYDLAGAAHADPRVDLAVLHREAPDVERFVRDSAAPHYTSAGADNLETLPQGDLLAPPGDAVGRQWRTLVIHHPWLYLRTRASVFWSTLATSAADACPVVFVGVQTTELDQLSGSGLKPRFSQRDAWDAAYAQAFVGTPVFSHLLWGILLLALMGVALRDLARGDRRPELIAVLALVGAALLFTASFFVVSSACDYRYLYFLDVAATAALVRQAGAWGRTANPSIAGP